MYVQAIYYDNSELKTQLQTCMQLLISASDYNMAHYEHIGQIQKLSNCITVLTTPKSSRFSTCNPIHAVYPKDFFQGP